MFAMLPSLQFLFLLSYGFFPWCTATEVLPRAPHAAFQPPGFAGLHDVLVAREGEPDLPYGSSPRICQLGNAAQKGIAANSSSTFDKRDCPGTNHDVCPGTQICCPLDFNCCLGTNSCAPQGGTCCSGGGGCGPDEICCSAFHCAPKESFCCSDGIHYCPDLTCRNCFSGSPPPSITLPSHTPLSTLPSITIPTITIPTSITEYFWYTTTFTWYYYSYFITYIAPVSQRTSRYTSTTQTVSVYASNTADATSQFATLSSDLAFTTAVTAPGYTSALPSPTSSTSGGPSLVAFTGGAKGAKTGFGGLGAAALMGSLGVLTCLLMVWL